MAAKLNPKAQVFVPKAFVRDQPSAPLDSREEEPKLIRRIGISDLPLELLVMIFRLAGTENLSVLLRLRCVHSRWRDQIQRFSEYSQFLKNRMERTIKRLDYATRHISELGAYFEIYAEVRKLIPSYNSGPTWERIDYSYRKPGRFYSTYVIYSVTSHLEKAREKITEFVEVLNYEDFERPRTPTPPPPPPKYYRRFFSCCGLSDSGSEYETASDQDGDKRNRYVNTGSDFSPHYEYVGKHDF